MNDEGENRQRLDPRVGYSGGPDHDCRSRHGYLSQCAAGGIECKINKAICTQERTH